MRSSSWLDILGYVLLFPVFVLDVVSHVVMSFFGSSNINKTNKNKKKTYSQYSTARGNATATRGEPRSSSSSSGTLMSIFRVDGDDHESKTIYEMTQRAVALHGDNRIAMRSRKFVELRKKHENDRFPSKVYDDENGFDDVTYRDLGRVTEQFGKGLRALGLQKKTTGGDDDNNNNNNNNNNPIKLNDDEHLTEWEIAQIRLALEESERYGMDYSLATRGTSPTSAKQTTIHNSAHHQTQQHHDNLPSPHITSTPYQHKNDNDNYQYSSDSWQTEAAQYLSPEELQQIQQALQEETHETQKAPVHVTDEEGNQKVAVAPVEGFITEQERLAIAAAIAQADAAAEQKSYYLALQLAAQEQAPLATAILGVPTTQQQQQPQGNVRVVTRAQLMHERQVGARHARGSGPRHPLEQHEQQQRQHHHHHHHHDHDDEDDDDDEEEQHAAGFRMNATSPQAWQRRDAHTVIGPDRQIRTKHDAQLSAQANAHRLALLDDDIGVGHQAYNSFHQSMKRNRTKGVAMHGTGRAGSDADGVKGGAMDARVREHLTKMTNQGWISKLNGAVKEGKEALIYHGEQGDESDGFDVAVKVFKRIQEFKGRGSYVDGDPRYAAAAFAKSSAREQLELWTEKEYRNLVRANRAGVPVATPLHYKDNILLMRFLGEDGWPSPQLREIDLRKGSKRWTTLYTQVMQSMRLLYQGAHLVHGDLSEYNVLAVPAFLVENQMVVDTAHEMQAVLIDFGQAVDTRHPDAEELLRRDLDRVQSFFSKQGAATMPTEEAYYFCVLPDETTDGEEVEEEEKEENMAA